MHCEKLTTNNVILFIKEFFQILCVCMLWVLLLPFLTIVALAISLESRGPIFFRQERLGKNGNIFYILKFRTMHLDGEERLRSFLKNNEEARKEWESFRKLKKIDPRITFIGKILRKTSIDEIPQLWNIMKREMSLVGPRPYMPVEKSFIEEQDLNIILSVKPGITGLWQVSGRNNLSFEDRIILDLKYVKTKSLTTDLWILLKTIKVVLSRSGAY